MAQRHLTPTVVNFNTVMDACAKAGEPLLAKEVLAEMQATSSHCPDTFREAVV